MVRRGKEAVMFLVFSIREITTSQLALTRVWVEKYVWAGEKFELGSGKNLGPDLVKNWARVE